MQATPFRRSLLSAALGSALAVASGSVLASAFALVETSVSGLGNAYAGAAASAEDAATIWWNPAGMTNLNGMTVTAAMHVIVPSAKFNDKGSQAACVSAAVCRPFGGNGGDAGDAAFVPNMYLAIYWDETTGRCSLERKSESEIEIFPLRGDGSEGRWRWGSEKIAKHIDWLHPKRSERTGRLDVEHRLYLDASIAVDDEPEEDESDEDEEGVVERTSKPKSIWLGGGFSTDSAKRSLKELLPGDAFDFPKSLDFLRTCVLLGSSGDLISKMVQPP